MASQLDRIESRLDKIVAEMQEIRNVVVSGRSTGGLEPRPEEPTPTPGGLHPLPGDGNQPRPPQGDQGGEEQGEGRSGLRAADLTPQDLAYMRHIHENALHRLGKAGKARNQDVYKALLVGSLSELNKAKNEGEYSNEWASWRADMQTKVHEYHQNGNPQLIMAYNEWIARELS